MSGCTGSEQRQRHRSSASFCGHVNRKSLWRPIFHLPHLADSIQEEILRPTYEYSSFEKVVSTLPPVHVTNSTSGMSRLFSTSPSEYSPITGSAGHANSTLLSIPRNTGLSDLPRSGNHSGGFLACLCALCRCSPNEEGVRPHAGGSQPQHRVCYTQRQRSL